MKSLMQTLTRTALAAAMGAGIAANAFAADLKVGLSVSLSGPNSSLGVPYAKGMQAALAYKPEVNGRKIQLIVLDDGSDPTTAGRNARKLVDEDKVDVLMGTSGVPAAIAMAQVGRDAKVPMIGLTPIQLDPAENGWVFTVAQPTQLMIDAVVQRMKKDGVKTVGYIGFADAYGEGWYNEFSKAAALKGITVVANERFARNDSSVTAQVLKLQAARPDAILIGGSGTPAALPQITLKERGYAGLIYQTHGVANADFLRVGGKNVEGTYLPAGPVLVARQLPVGNAVRTSAIEYVTKYEAAYGKDSVSTFGGHAWDAGQLMAAAVPVALKKAQPGTPEFRAALRDALESVKNVAGAHGIYNMSPTDHLGLDQRARVMVKIENGAWKVQQ